MRDEVVSSSREVAGLVILLPEPASALVFSRLFLLLVLSTSARMEETRIGRRNAFPAHEGDQEGGGGMTGLLDGFDNCLAVVIHAPQLDAVAMLVGLKKRIGRLQARRDRIADAAQIDDMSIAHLTIERNMGMTHDDQVCLTASQPLLQFVIAVLALDPGSVISA